LTTIYFAGLHGLLVAGTGNKVEDFGWLLQIWRWRCRPQSVLINEVFMLAAHLKVPIPF
jgi:hypothetical protein